jgi:hypothetical protein
MQKCRCTLLVHPTPVACNYGLTYQSRLANVVSFGWENAEPHSCSSKWWNHLIRNWILIRSPRRTQMVPMVQSRSKSSVGRVTVLSHPSGPSVDAGTCMLYSTRKHPYSRISPLGGLRSYIVCMAFVNCLTKANIFE